MITNIFLDIETVPGDTFYQKKVAASITPPATITKPETLAKWLAEKMPQAVEDAVHATSLMPAYNRIVCLSWAINDADPTTFSGNSEEAILGCFFEDLAGQLEKERNAYSYRVIGHNISGFDLPCLWHACIRNNVPYSFLPNPRTIKPWETSKVVDTLAVLAGRDFKGMSLGNLAKLYGLNDAHPDVDGSMVWQMWREGMETQVADYCAGDVRLVRALYHRIKEFLP